MRPTKHATFIEIAIALSKQGTCSRRKVGAVLINSMNHIIGTGYNGSPRGMQHCIDNKEVCSGSEALSGERLELCNAIHAEQNALLQCYDVNQIEACYTTSSPCMHCIKMLMNTSCKTIFYLERYSVEPLKYWEESGRKAEAIT